MSDLQFIYRMRFRSFVDFAFRELHPGEFFLRNWHIDLMAEILQLIYHEPTRGMNRLIFNLPPGYLKTHICSVSFPAWVLGRDPRKSVLIMSEDPVSALEIQERCAELMSSCRYRAIFPRTKITKCSRTLELNYGGGIRHAGMGYTSQRKKSDIVIIDNPQSLSSLDRIKPENFAEIGRLLKNQKEGIMILSTRRLGKDDLSSFLYQKLGGWTRFAIPVVALNDWTWDLPPDIHQIQKAGELLHDSHEEWTDIQGHLEAMGGETFSFQYLQGQYSPPKTGEIDMPEEDGVKWKAVGAFDSTWVTSRHLENLRSQLASNLSV